PASARRPAHPPLERVRAAPPAEAEGRARRNMYIPLKLRVALTVLAGLLWLGFSLWLSRRWISALGDDLTVPGAVLVIWGIALIPGYLNIQLLGAILLDQPPALRFDVPFPEVA